MTTITTIVIAFIIILMVAMWIALGLAVKYDHDNPQWYKGKKGRSNRGQEN